MKHLSAFLALLMILTSLAACASDTPGEDTTATPAAGDGVSDSIADTTEPVITETGRADVKDNIPDDFTMNGEEIGIYARSGSVRGLDVDGGEEQNGDSVYDAVHERTARVAERVDVVFEVTEVAGKWQDFGNSMQQNILSGDDVWQIVFTTGNASIQSSRDYLFMDLTTNKYIDFEQPWWWKDAMDALSIDSKSIRYLVGDICLTNYTKSAAMYFNQRIFEDNFGDPEALYQLVIDRKWTYDKLMEYASQSYNDLNGDGTLEVGEQYGLLCTDMEFLRHMEYSADFQRYTRNDAGIPFVEYDVERAEQFVSILNKLFHETTGTAYFPKDSGVGADNFTSAQATFFAGRLNNTLGANFREMEDDYGIVPYPLMDENQAEYTGIIHNSSDYVCIPTTCKTPNEIGAVIEALCAESYRSVVELFYETALKTKYSRDALSGQCIDIIRATSVKNFIYEYHSVVGSGTIIATLVANNNNAFTSTYEKGVDSTNKKIEALVAKYEKMNQQ